MCISCIDFSHATKLHLERKLKKNGKRTKRRTSFLGGHFTHPEISYFRFMMGFGFNSCFIVPYMLSKCLLLVARSIAVFKYTLSMAISLDWERLLDLANHVKSRSDRSFVRPPISIQAWVIAPPPSHWLNRLKYIRLCAYRQGCFFDTLPFKFCKGRHSKLWIYYLAGGALVSEVQFSTWMLKGWRTV